MTKKYYLLVVDDDPISQFVISEMLKQQFEIHCVDNGQQCIESIRNKKPDLLLLDVNMPVLNGYETCKILRADSAYQNLPIIILSALIKEKEITAGYTAGCDLYITKPFKQDELITKISQLLDKSYKNKDKEKKIR